MAKRARKLVYAFGGDKADGDASMKELLGGKGANLAEMVRLGIPVPPGFTITTEACNAYFENGGRLPSGLRSQVQRALAAIKKETGKEFGHTERPLLVSVRSGAPVSMPGMMDTILNLGINDEVAERMAELTGNARFVYDAYRRFVMMYGDVVLGVHRGGFERLVDKVKQRLKIEQDYEIPAAELKKIVDRSKRLIAKEGHEFPDDPVDQLWGAVGAVFDSWNNPRAMTYRELNHIPPHWGTAVNVQTMVFGNTGDNSATGVAFTRDPATGEDVFYGEWLRNAQGEDVVAGIRTPHRLDEKTAGELSLEICFPEVYRRLVRIQRKLEKHYRDMQDIEFTVEEGRLWVLQTRVGKRTGFAAVRMAADMVAEKLIKPQEALLRIQPEQLNHLLRPIFDLGAKRSARVLATGLAAGPGAATGRIALSAEKAMEMAAAGDVILVRHETSPEDIAGMNAAQGILTSRGGMTSHAALVARQMGKVCVAGCRDAVVDYRKGAVAVGGEVLREGDFLSLDGSSGEVLAGEIPTMPSEVMQILFGRGGKRKAERSVVYQTYETLMKSADRFRDLGVRTNADQGDQAGTAVTFGAEGIGLTRTEHMFFGEGKIGPMRQMILAEDEKSRRKALGKLLPLQRRDFAGIFKAMDGKPVTIRTLDPPLHEFLPHDREDVEQLAAEMKVPVDRILAKIRDLEEFNPMLGHRGCRLGISYPEITEMQARAIFEAAIQVKNKGVKVLPEIMIPLVGNVEELRLQERIVREIAAEVFERKGVEVPYLVGTMIEVPRAALTADEVAESAEFFSFGTNDLTQTALGMSRDDSREFLANYKQLGIYPRDPFAALDREGVGRLVEIGVRRGRETRPKLKIGICGEHGGEPTSIEFCHRAGLDYVSCSPYRVPIARLAAAQAALRFPRDEGKPAQKRTRGGKATGARKSTKKKTAGKKTSKKKTARKKTAARRSARGRK